jgi:putative copper export protein
MIVQLQTTRELLLSGTIILCLLLAVATLVLMWMRTRPREDGSEAVRPPFDPVLLGSAVAVVVMAIIAWYSL